MTIDLERFVKAQSPVYPGVVRELASGQKQSHWMWFVFPQLQGLGRSHMASYYALGSRAEARAYWDHPLLGRRLQECTELVLAAPHQTAHDIFGSPDDLKFRSSMTLFSVVAPEQQRFTHALQRFFGGRACPKTLELLAALGE